MLDVARLQEIETGEPTRHSDLGHGATRVVSHYGCSVLVARRVPSAVSKGP